MYAGSVSNSNNVVLTATKKAEGLTAVQSLTCGGVAGAASRTVTSPLDVVKILFQVQAAPVKAGAEAVGHAQGGRTVYTGFFNAFATIYREEGLKAFWKGNAVACLRLFPYSAVKFFTFDELKPVFADKNGKLNPNRSVLCGALAGISATVVTYPLDLIKTRLTVQHEGKAELKAYNGVWDAFVKIYRAEGVRGWYKGAWTSVLGVIPFEGGTFMFYELLKNFASQDKVQLSPFQNFMNGCLGAAFAQTFSYPFDLVRKRLQAQSKAKGMLGEQYKGMGDCFSKIVKNEGFFGLYKGTSANLAKVAPYAGIMFATWEQCKVTFVWYNKTYGYQSKAALAKSAAAGTPPATVTKA